jgi:hypothetical protein
MTKCKCPYCGADGNACVPDVAFMNAEAYGSQIFNVKCRKCGKIVRAEMQRTVRVAMIEETDATWCDWGEKQSD